MTRLHLKTARAYQLRLAFQEIYSQPTYEWGALFLDRWIKASLLDGASPCDEVDNLRRSIVSPRFLGLTTALFLLWWLP